MRFSLAPRTLLAIALVAACTAPRPSHASSNEAWRMFRHDVATACRQAAAGTLTIARISVDPWGSPHYGLARLIGTTPDGEHARRQLLCVYDKHSHAAEIGSPMPIQPMPADTR